MSDIFRRLSNTFRRLAKDTPESEPQERRRAPRLVCSAPVMWEVGREQGEGQLREVSATGLRIRTRRAILAGKHIRVRPRTENDSAPLSTDVAVGTVVYTRKRGSEFELGIELVNPERLSRFAWVSQLLQGARSPSAIPVVLPEGKPHLRLLKKSDGNALPRLLRNDADEEKEKNSKK